MAKDAVTFIKAMGFERVDLLGFSMGGMIAPEIVLMEPQLVRKMIIAGTGTDEYLSCKRLGHEFCLELEHRAVSAIGIDDEVAYSEDAAPKSYVFLLGTCVSVIVGVTDLRHCVRTV